MKKFSINIFIVITLGMMTWSNIARNSGPFYFPYSTQHPGVVALAHWGNKIQNTFYNFFWVAGLRNYWRMFAPVDRFNWHFIVTAVYPDGRKERILMPSQKEHNFISYNFVNFREGKYELNIYNNEKGQTALAEYYCHSFRHLKNSAPKEIVLERAWQVFVSDDRAGDKYHYRHPVWARHLIRTVTCKEI